MLRSHLENAPPKLDQPRRSEKGRTYGRSGQDGVLSIRNSGHVSLENFESRDVGKGVMIETAITAKTTKIVTVAPFCCIL